MFEHINTLVKITCDKCGNFDTARESNHNDMFFQRGWSVNPRAKKYIHKCGKCNGKHAPNKVWERVKPMLEKHPLINKITEV